MEPRIEELKVEQLIPVSGSEQILEEDLESGKFDALCPCHVAANYLLAHEKAYEILTSQVKKKRLICVLNREILELKDKKIKTLSQKDPEKTYSSEEEVAFVKPGLFHNPEKLLSNRFIQEVFQLEEVGRNFFPTLTIDPPLHLQEGSSEFRRHLSRSFTFLNPIGLIPQEILNSELAFSSILMLIRRALGMKEVSWLSAYLEHPARFLASAISNKFFLEEKETKKIEQALENFVDSPPQPMKPVTWKKWPRFRLSSESALYILDSLGKASSKRVQQLENLKEALPSAVITNMGATRANRIIAILLRPETGKLLDLLSRQKSQSDKNKILDFLLHSQQNLHAFADLVSEDLLLTKNGQFSLTRVAERFMGEAARLGETCRSTKKFSSA
jgi:hypothetical protein